MDDVDGTRESSTVCDYSLASLGICTYYQYSPVALCEETGEVDSMRRMV